MTELHRLQRQRVGKSIKSAVGFCEVYAESERDAREQAAAEHGEEWLDPDLVSSHKSHLMTLADAVPKWMRGIKASGLKAGSRSALRGRMTAIRAS